MTLSLIDNSMSSNDVESSLYRLNEEARRTGVQLLLLLLLLLFSSYCLSVYAVLFLVNCPAFFSNEVLYLRLNICLYYLLLIFNVTDNVRNNTLEKCKTKPMLPECLFSQPYEHLSYKQSSTMDMLFASFLVEQSIESTHTYRIGDD